MTAEFYHLIDGELEPLDRGERVKILVSEDGSVHYQVEGHECRVRQDEPEECS